MLAPQVTFAGLSRMLITVLIFLLPLSDYHCLSLQSQAPSTPSPPQPCEFYDQCSCSNQGNPIREVICVGLPSSTLPHLPPNVHIFRLNLINSPDIRSLPSRSFGRSLVSSFTFKRGKLVSIDANAFDGSEETLTTLDLSYNDLYEWPFSAKILSHFSVLQWLSLKGNKITQLNLSHIRYNGVHDVSNNGHHYDNTNDHNNSKNNNSIKSRVHSEPSNAGEYNGNANNGTSTSHQQQQQNDWTQSSSGHNPHHSRSSMIRNLILSNNLLTYIPDSLFIDLSQLQSLDLDNNRITDIHGRRPFPESLSSLSLANNLLDRVPTSCLRDLDRLRWFTLRGNLIRNLPNYWPFSTKHIDILDLSHNLLSTLDSNFFISYRRSFRTASTSNPNTFPSYHQRLRSQSSVSPSHQHDKHLNSIETSASVKQSGESIVNDSSTISNSNLLIVKDLLLDFNFIQNIDHNTFYNVSIERLSLSNNMISQLPSDLFQNHLADRLRALDISHNLLTEYPVAMKSLANVNNIFLRGNKLSSLEADCFQSSSGHLSILDLSENRLRSVPSVALEKTTKLIKLNLADNYIHRLDTIDFGSWSANLVSLSVSKNGLKYIAQDAFRELRSLRELRISHNNLLYTNRIGTFSVYKSFLEPLKSTLVHLELSFAKQQSRAQQRPLNRYDDELINDVDDLGSNINARGQQKWTQFGQYWPQQLLNVSPMDRLEVLEMDRNRLGILSSDLMNKVTASQGSLVHLDLEGNHLESIPSGMFIGRQSKDFELTDKNDVDTDGDGDDGGDGNDSKNLPVNGVSKNSKFRSSGSNTWNTNQPAKQLRNIILANNRLGPAIGRESGFANLHQLGSIDLRGNDLQTIYFNTFTNLSTLSTIILARNSLKSMSTRAFVNCNSLVNILLQENNLHTLSMDTFVDIFSHFDEHSMLVDDQEDSIGSDDKNAKDSSSKVNQPGNVHQQSDSGHSNSDFNGGNEDEPKSREFDQESDQNQSPINHMGLNLNVSHNQIMVIKYDGEIIGGNSGDKNSFSSDNGYENNVSSDNQNMQISGYNDNYRKQLNKRQKRQKKRRKVLIKSLDLSFNLLTNLTTSMGRIMCEKLITLKLDYNRFTQFPFDFLIHCPRLRTLTMKNNQIQSYHQPPPPPPHQQQYDGDDLSSSSHLNGSSSSPASTSSTPSSPPTHLSCCSKLALLDLSHNNITSLESLGLPFNQLRSLVNIDLSYNKIKRLPCNIFHGTIITRLSLANNLLINHRNYASNIGDGGGDVQLVRHVSDVDVGEHRNVSTNNTVTPRRHYYHAHHSHHHHSSGGGHSPWYYHHSRWHHHHWNSHVHDCHHYHDQQCFGVPQTLHYLDLSHNRLDSLPHGMIAGCRSLITIDLSGNFIHILTDHWFTAFRHVEEINLSHNRLLRIDGKAFDRLENLIKLCLNNCSLSSIPHLDAPKLLYLELNDNRIGNISGSSLYKSKKLRSLDLAGNLLKEVPGQLGHFDQLIHLNIAHNPIHDMEESNFSPLRTLQSIDIRSLSLRYIDQRTFNNIRHLTELRTSTYPMVRSFRLPELLSKSHSLRTALIEVDDSTLSHQIQWAFGAKLRELIITGHRLEKILPDTFLGLYHRPDLTLRITQTNVTELPAGLLRYITDIRHMTIDLRGNQLHRLSSQVFSPWLDDYGAKENPPTTSNMIIRTHLSGGILVDNNPLDCRCDLLWLTSYFHRWLRDYRRLNMLNYPAILAAETRIRQARCRPMDRYNSTSTTPISSQPSPSSSIDEELLSLPSGSPSSSSSSSFSSSSSSSSASPWSTENASPPYTLDTPKTISLIDLYREEIGCSHSRSVHNHFKSTTCFTCIVSPLLLILFSASFSSSL
ncbi:uncharacterized protein LOC141854476 [Brevipalpus obovatus]|uniref:uncharacterized protein LOC141854476 n=1 Tax=Brevipalpus obovatus TaxID=246614 RepID=UPI003D9EB564